MVPRPARTRSRQCSTIEGRCPLFHTGSAISVRRKHHGFYEIRKENRRKQTGGEKGRTESGAPGGSNRNSQAGPHRHSEKRVRGFDAPVSERLGGLPEG